MQKIYLLVVMATLTLMMSSCALKRSSMAEPYLNKAQDLSSYCEANNITNAEVDEARELITKVETGLKNSPDGDDETWSNAELASMMLSKAINIHQLENAKNELSDSERKLKEEKATLKAYKSMLNDVKVSKGGVQ